MSQDYLDKLIEKDKAGTQIQSIPLHDTELRGITIDDPITVEGNPINFSTKNEQNAIQTVVNLEPIQDLHGYSKPWVGGAGKNKFKLDLATIKEANPNGTWTGNVFVKRGVTFTVNIDPDSNITNIKINGTAEAGGFCDFNFFESTRKTLDNFGLSIGSTYIFTNGYASDNANISLQYNGSINNIVASKNGTTFTVNNSDTYYPQIRIAANTVISNLYVYPMVRLSTETDSSFEPYTNICPILPHEEIKIGGCGKNLYIGSPSFDDYTNIGNWTQDSSTHDGHKVYKRQYAWSGMFKYITLPIGTYIFSCYAKADDNNHACGIYILNENTTATITPPTYSEFVISNTWNRYSYTFNVTSTGTVALRFESRTSSDSNYIYISEYQLEQGNQASIYEPYTISNNLSIDLPSTVYGGTLNLETGELVVDRIKVTNFASTDITEGVDGNDAWLNVWFAFNASLGIMGSISEAERQTHIKNDKSNYSGNWHFANVTNQIHYYNGGTRVAAFYPKSYFADINAFKTYEASNRAEFVLSLSTPYTLHLTPHQLKLFKDVNNLNSSDYTTLTVTYHSNSIATLAPATDTTDGLLTAMDKRALDRTEEIVEGNPIAFKTESAQVAKSTIVDLEPIQDLHGYSKPWVGGAGKNKLDYSLVQQKSGCTYTINTDGSLTVVADAYTNTNPQIVLTGLLSSGTYTFSNIEGISGYVMFAEGDYSHSVSLGGSYTFTYDGSSYLSILYNVQNHSTTRTYKGMIEEGSTATSYEPYENICPISGRSEVDILGCGKNLASNITSLTNHVQYNTCLLSDAELEPNTTYTISFKGTVNNRIYSNESLFTSNSAFIITSGTNIRVLTTKSILSKEDSSQFSPTYNGWTIFKNSSTDNADNNFTEVMIEKGSLATGYSPYIESNDFTISFGQTIYGGQLDVENGFLVVDRTYIEFDGSVDENWGKSGALPAVFYMLNSNISPAIKSSSVLVNNRTKYVDNLDDYVYGCCYSDNNAISFYLGTVSETVEEWKTWLASNNLQVVYELATPTTISLTPEQVKLLQGVNTITTNADNITLTYRNGSVATLNDLESLYDKLKVYIDSLHSS